MSKKGIAVCSTVFLVCIAIAVWAQKKSMDRVVSERFVSKVPSSYTYLGLKDSPDDRWVAYLTGERNKLFVVVDGEEGRQYDSISYNSLIFSPDSKRVVYGVKMGEKCFVVVDGDEGRQYKLFKFSSLLGQGVVFNAPDSLYFLVYKGNDIYLVEERIKWDKDRNKATLLLIDASASGNAEAFHFGNPYYRSIIAS